MLKGIPIGLLMGAILAFVLFRVVEAKRDARPAMPVASAGAGQAATSPESDALKTEISSLGTAKSKLESELAGLNAKLATEKAAMKVNGGAAGDAKKFKNPWSPMAALLFRLKDKLDELEKEDSEDYRDLMMQFMEIAKELTEERGFDLGDFESSPFGPPMLMLAVLEGADPPMDPADLERASAIVAKVEADWLKAKEKKAEQSALEWKVSAARIVWESMKNLKGGLTPEQRDWFKTGKMWSDDTVRIWSRGVSGTQEQCQVQLVDDWAQVLSVTDIAAAPLRPLAGQFVREYQEMEDAWKRRETAGEKIADAEKSLGRAELAIAVQKKIRESMTLTPAQEKALKSLGNSWEVTITPERSH
ncbi:MAG: hypothetical protein K8T20_13670 [Planctomycetes bacterium]|nr:hypothetical protein [Planctomycetota bacterium]